MTNLKNEKNERFHIAIKTDIFRLVGLTRSHSHYGCSCKHKRFTFATIQFVFFWIATSIQSLLLQHFHFIRSLTSELSSAYAKSWKFLLSFSCFFFHHVIVFCVWVSFTQQRLSFEWIKQWNHRDSSRWFKGKIIICTSKRTEWDRKRGKICGELIWKTKGKWRDRYVHFPLI